MKVEMVQVDTQGQVDNWKAEEEISFMQEVQKKHRAILFTLEAKCSLSPSLAVLAFLLEVLANMESCNMMWRQTK